MFIIPKGSTVTINGKVYRTLEAQVAWNKERIEAFTKQLDELDIDALEGLSEAVEALESDVVDIKENVEDLQEDVSANRASIDGLIVNVGANTSNISANASAIDQLEYDMTQTQGDIQGLGTTKQNKYRAVSVTIEPSDWALDQPNGFRATKTVQGVTATNLVQVAPATESIDDYMDNNIICDAQSANTLEWNAKDISSPPSSNIYVNVVVWEA